jgi:hypothetical protein
LTNTPAPERDLRTVITIKRRLDHDVNADFTEQVAQQSGSPGNIAGIARVVTREQLPRSHPRGDEFRVHRRIQFSA